MYLSFMDAYAIGMKTAKKNMLGDSVNPEKTFIRTYKRRVRRPTAPHISEDLVLRILVLLPVEALLRCKTVCKAWHAIISDPWFIRTHLQHSALQQQSFLLVPHTLDGVSEEDAWATNFSNDISFYRWQLGHDTARLLLHKHFHGDFGSVYKVSHRDGLVLFPTDTKVYVINPATRDVLVLPDGQRDTMLANTSRNQFQSVGFGLDTRTKRYKVARFFFRSVDILARTYSMGMEVFTISGDGNDDASWQETLLDPPYPIQGCQNPPYFKGSLFWRINWYLLKQPSQGFLRFHLEDETFSFIPQPASAFDDELFQIMERGGEQLFLAQCQSAQHLVIWMFCDDNRSHQWVQLHSVNILGPVDIVSASMLHNGLFFHVDGKLYRCDVASGIVKEVVCMDQLRYGRERAGGAFECDRWENVYAFSFMPYIESLVPVSTARSEKRMHRLSL